MLGKMLNAFNVLFPLAVQISEVALIILAWRTNTEHIVWGTVCPWLAVRWEDVLASGFACASAFRNNLRKQKDRSLEPLQCLLYMHVWAHFKAFISSAVKSSLSGCILSCKHSRAFPTYIYKPIWMCWGSSWRIGLALAIPGSTWLWTSCYS